MIVHCLKHKFEFQPRDCWVGFYWEKRIKRTEGLNFVRVRHLWICLIPMLPLHISWQVLEEDS
jgi:hypothetical protein